MINRPQVIVIALLGFLVIGLAWQDRASFHQPPRTEHSATSDQKATSSTDKTKTQSLLIPTDSVGLYTLVLASFTGILAVVSFFQGIMLLKANKTAQVAATAAKESADASFAAERARFFIVIDDHDLTYLTGTCEASVTPPLTEGGVIPGGNFNVKYRFRNYGKTPGIISEIAVDSRIATDPVDPVFTLSINDYPESMIGPQDSTPLRTYNPPAQPTVAQIRAVKRNNARFWFFGRLYYDDVFGNHQVHRFYFRSVWLFDESGKCILQPYDYEHHNQST